MMPPPGPTARTSCSWPRNDAAPDASTARHPPVKIYRVGGSVRDELLGLDVKDRDWVVVGATPDELVARGFRPVGRDFPVFLHPETNEEYALARTERKSVFAAQKREVQQ